MNSAASPPPPTDMHVHIAGNGLRGSGCWIKVAGARKTLASFMLRHIGLGVPIDSPDFDDAYGSLVASLVRNSSLGAAVILANDEVYQANGQKMDFGSFHVPNRHVFALAREHPEFLPACSIHPARPDAFDELAQCLENGAVILKLLPNCHNVDCNDPRYRRFWEKMAEAKLPLLAHTGGEHTVPVCCRHYSDPRILTLPLECGVTCIAAHSGTKSGLTDPEYFHVFCDMLAKYPNLYGDTSAFNVPIRGRHVRACVREPLASRLVHGSDFPVPVYGVWAWLQGFINWANYRRCDTTPNVIERDYQLKRAMGFTDDHFTRIHRLLRARP